MRNLFHLNLKYNRSDSMIVEAVSLDSLKQFYNRVSLSILQNVKKIVYSKKYNINYTPYNFVPTGRYKKVIVFASSLNYTEIFTLFHVKKTITEEQLINDFKNLYIKDEQIIDIIDVQFFEMEGNLSPTDIKNKHQVQYQIGGKTFVEDFYSKDYQTLLSVVKSIIDGEITEIRSYLHFDNSIKTDNPTNCYSSVSINLYDENIKHSFKITNVKHTISHDELLTLVQQTFKLDGKTVDLSKMIVRYN